MLYFGIIYNKIYALIIIKKYNTCLIIKLLIPLYYYKIIFSVIKYIIYYFLRSAILSMVDIRLL